MSFWDPVLERYRVKTDPSYLERRIELCLIFFLGFLFLQFSVGVFQVFSDSLPKPTLPLSEVLDVASEIDSTDIAPTLLQLLNLPIPIEMTGKSLIQEIELKGYNKVVQHV